jgi:hypothetical protein
MGDFGFFASGGKFFGGSFAIGVPFCGAYNSPQAVILEEMPDAAAACAGKQAQLPVAGPPTGPQELQHHL